MHSKHFHTGEAADNVLNTINANNNKATFAYNALNRLTTSTDPLVKSTTSVYDAATNQISLTDPANNTTTFVFDVLNVGCFLGTQARCAVSSTRRANSAQLLWHPVAHTGNQDQRRRNPPALD